MLTRELISNSIPYLQKHDKVFQALQLMNDYHVSHLPVVEEKRYLGIISEEQLLQVDEEAVLEQLALDSNNNTMVQATDHFLKAIHVAVQNNLSVVPVMEENEIVGLVTYNDLLRNTSDFMALSEPGALIVLEMESRAYSFSEINRIVESNDAQITQLNTHTEPETGTVQVTLKVSKLEVSDLVSSFQRYEYNIKYYFGEELYENELRNNYDNLMHFLSI